MPPIPWCRFQRTWWCVGFEGGDYSQALQLGFAVMCRPPFSFGFEKKHPPIFPEIFPEWIGSDPLSVFVDLIQDKTVPIFMAGLGTGLAPFRVPWRKKHQKHPFDAFDLDHWQCLECSHVFTSFSKKWGAKLRGTAFLYLDAWVMSEHCRPLLNSESMRRARRCQFVAENAYSTFRDSTAVNDDKADGFKQSLVNILWQILPDRCLSHGNIRPKLKTLDVKLWCRDIVLVRWLSSSVAVMRMQSTTTGMSWGAYGVWEVIREKNEK